MQNTISFYDSIKDKELNEIINNLEWTKKEGREALNDDGESMFLENLLKQHMSFGSTDYKDHRNDSLQTVKKLITNSINDCSSQRLNFYSLNWLPVKKIIVEWYFGGYTGTFVYEWGKNAIGR